MASILVVDDEPEIVRLVSLTLEARGHVVTVARDGQEALDAIARERPDVVVIDTDLPKLDGLEVTRRLRASAETAALPIVLMSARIPTVAEVAAEGGPDEYLVKPIPRELLVRNVERLLPPA